jgi:uncharacterized protein YlxW (UPF0749 family)
MDIETMTMIINALVTIISTLIGSGAVGGIILFVLSKRKFNAEVKQTQVQTDNTEAQTTNLYVEVANKVTEQVNEQNKKLQEHIMQLEDKLKDVEIERKKDKESFEIRLGEAERKIEELEDENCSMKDWTDALVKQLEAAELVPVPFKKKKKTRQKVIQEGKDG